MKVATMALAGASSGSGTAHPYLLLLLPLLAGTQLNRVAGDVPPPATTTPSPQSIVEEPVCYTEGCNRTAEYLARSMNASADPCEDFFEFVCGSFVRETAIPTGKASVSVITMLEVKLRLRLMAILTQPSQPDELRPFKMARTLYGSCMNTSYLEELGLEPARKILSRLGGWPVIEGDKWDEEKFDWKALNYKMMEMGLYGDYLFTFGLYIDISNTSRHAIAVGMPNLNLDLKAYDGVSSRIRLNDYVETARRAAMMLLPDADSKEAHRVADEMMEMAMLEVQLNTHTRSLEDRRNLTLHVNPMNVSALQEAYPYVPWLEYMRSMLPPGSNVTATETVIVLDKEYLSKLGGVLERVPKRTLANYMMWRALKEVLPLLNAAARDLVAEHETGGRGVPRQRWEECVTLVQESMRPVTSAMYVRHFSSEEARKTAAEMVQDISKEMYHLLESVDWMDPATRRAAMSKAEAMRYNVGYPDELMNDTVLTEHYEAVEFDADGHLLDSILALERDALVKNGKKLHTDVKKQDWTFMTGIADVVNAFYAHGENSLSIPAGILQGAFFESDRPQYMNYGGIGFAIGHEVSHGFDETGRLFDMHGLMHNWWDSETSSRFNDKVRCIVEQYGNLTSKQINATVNGVITQSENIADNAALKLAHRAYHRFTARRGPEPRLPLRLRGRRSPANGTLALNPRQLFWVSFASIWCSKDTPKELMRKLRTSNHLPGALRVNGAVRNQRTFASDFNCPVGARMNPAHKCELW